MLLTVPLASDRVQSARESARSAGELGLSQDVGGVIADLQQERLISDAYLATPSSEGNPVVRQAAQTDADLSDLRGKWRQTHISSSLTSALQGVTDLDKARAKVLRRALKPAEANTAYANVISALIDALPLSDSSAGSGEGAFGREQASLDALLRVHESNSGFCALLLALVSDPAQARQLMADVQGQTAISDEEKARFFRLATTAEKDLFQTIESGSAASKINSYSDALALWAYANPDSGAQRGDLPQGVTVSRILAASDSLDQLRLLVQNKIAHDSAAAASSNASHAGTTALVFTLAVLALAIAMVWLAVWMGRSISVPLTQLHHAAEQVAQVAEAEMTRLSEDAEKSSSEHATAHLQRVPTLTTDELGELAVAFNRVQDAAVALMERQVRSRENASAMLGNIGRRTQNLAALQLSMVDEMEQAETDPTQLENLYRLDHVSSRLRRYANSLVVISGMKSPVLTNSPVPLQRLTRSALGKIEGFRRVRIGDMPTLDVAAYIAADLSLVLTELLDNATSFSPPSAPVEIGAEAPPGEPCLIRIVDHGVGLTDEQLRQENDRFIRKERLDVISTDVLGLFVVGRLSRRHGLQVRLAHTPGRGVTVLITLPESAFHVPTSTPKDPEHIATGSQQPAIAATAEGRTAGPSQVEASEEPGRSSGEPAVPAPSADEGQQPFVPDGLSPFGTRKSSPAPDGPKGAFNWFNSRPDRTIEPVPHQEDVAANPARSRDERHLPPVRVHPSPPVPVSQPRPSTPPPLPPGPCPPAAAQPAPVLPRDSDGNGRPPALARRVPGAQMPARAVAPHLARAGTRPVSPDAARSMIEQFEAGVARAQGSHRIPETD
ncbi:nitrate- and nitrite sensing domain-containing protein [Streptomyces sp. NPDC048527]|uniref:sensor histidine kinase n=1 Tax=Streptomyces sp. NPDC048527 TaxID=3365568 RepID=UPI00371832A4